MAGGGASPGSAVMTQLLGVGGDDDDDFEGLCQLLKKVLVAFTGNNVFQLCDEPGLGVWLCDSAVTPRTRVTRATLQCS